MVSKVEANPPSAVKAQAQPPPSSSRAASRKVAWRRNATDLRSFEGPHLVHVSPPVIQKPSTPLSTDDLIERTHTRQVKARRQVFSRDLPFSWPRFFVGFVSLALVFSDIPRSGLGIRSLGELYPRVETDTTNFFRAPWNYTVFEATKSEAPDLTARVWNYKFDSTSIIWQAFARYLDAHGYPTCLLYRDECPTKRFSGETVFAMIDALVDAIVSATRPRREQEAPTAMTLRSENIYTDRVHNFLLPELFPSRNWRTNQALYFSPERLANLRVAEICFPSRPAAVPSFCQEHWINFHRSCPASDLVCQEVGLVYAHTIMRVREVEARFPNLRVGLTLLESQEDFQAGVGSLSAIGVRRADVTTIIRARECSKSTTGGLTETCETLYVNDYRYEVGLLVSDAAHWYKLVAALRSVGQVYFIARALGLMLSCYHALGKTSDDVSDPEGLVDRLSKARRLFMKVPTQCVVFGSPLPIILYTAAHAIDASIMYAVLENRFISQSGMLDLSLMDFVSVAVVQMRSVWLFALLWHAAVKFATCGRWTTYSHLSDGIMGVPEFLLSGMAGVTIISQFRSTSFRSSHILRMHEVSTPSGGSKLAVLRQNTFSGLGSGTKQLRGVAIDLKFLFCIAGLIAAALLLRSLVLIALATRGKRVDTFHWPLGTTPVPYSAGVLWPTVSLCVHWTSDFYCIHEQKRPGSIVKRLSQRATRVLPASFTFSKTSPRLSYHLVKHESSTRQLSLSMSLLSADAARMSLHTFSFIQFQMERLDARGDNVEANVAFMNLVLLSDPVVFFYMCVAGGGRTLAYYQSRRDPERVLLLPVVVVGDANEYTATFRKLREVNAAAMAWAALIQCG